jgi:uncharacterized repeat protein (TIGR01451 family)
MGRDAPWAERRSRPSRVPGRWVAVAAAVGAAIAQPVLVAGAGPASATETGPKIAFASYRNSAFPAPEADILVMDPDGSNATALTHDANNERNSFDPAWSPDGRKIAFTSDRAASTEFGSIDIWVMNADGSDPQQLTTMGAGASASGPTWSPDGSKIAYEAAGGISVMNADGTGQTLITPGDSTAQQPAWSPDGFRIAFLTLRHDGSDWTTFNWELYVMNADGSGQTRLTSTPVRVHDSHPAWSPDGMKIAYESFVVNLNSTAEDSDIFVINADGTNPTPLTAGPEYEARPAWSPDGSKIVFDQTYPCFDDCFPRRLVVMNADGSGQTPFADSFHDFSPEWQPYTDIELAISASSTKAKVNKPLTYTVTVLNHGPSAALNVVVTDPLPAGATFLSAVPSSGSCDGPPVGQTGTVTCRLGDIAAAQSRTTQIEVRLLQRRTTVDNTVTASTQTVEFDTSDNTATVSTQVK